MNVYKKYPVYTCLIILLALFSACSENNFEPEPQYLPDWTEVKGKSEFNLFYDIYFLNDNFGLISGTSGTLLKTPDGGANWKVDLDLDSLQSSSILKVIETENYMYVLDFIGRVFKKSKTIHDNNY